MLAVVTLVLLAVLLVTMFITSVRLMRTEIAFRRGYADTELFLSLALVTDIDQS